MEKNAPQRRGSPGETSINSPTKAAPEKKRIQYSSKKVKRRKARAGPNLGKALQSAAKRKPKRRPKTRDDGGLDVQDWPGR